MGKRQFRGTSKPRTFYERRLRPQGGSLSLSVSKVVPDKWRYVRIERIGKTRNSVTVKITKLLDDKDIASDIEVSETSEQVA